MGSHREAVLIVRKAIELRERNPDRSALSILDEAMKLSDGYTDLEWESSDPNKPGYVHPDYDREDYPPAPFAEILRQAFAPDLDVGALLLQDDRESHDYAVAQRVTDSLNIWLQRVTMPFSLRYGIEGGSWMPHVNILDKPDGYVEQALDRETWITRFAGHLMTWAGAILRDARTLAEQSYLQFRDTDPEKVAHVLLNDEQLARYEYYSTPAKPCRQC